VLLRGRDSAAHAHLDIGMLRLTKHFFSGAGAECRAYGETGDWFSPSAIAVEQIAEQFVECRLGVFEFLQRGVERLQREL
jgi:hypothetical protein